MGYGILQVYGFSLQTELVDAQNHGLLQVMGCHRDGLWQSRLYPSLNIFYFHVHEVSLVIVYQETLASDAVGIWQHLCERDAPGFHSFPVEHNEKSKIQN